MLSASSAEPKCLLRCKCFESALHMDVDAPSTDIKCVSIYPLIAHHLDQITIEEGDAFLFTPGALIRLFCLLSTIYVLISSEGDGLAQGSSNLSMKVQSAAEFSSKPDQTHLPVIF